MRWPNGPGVEGTAHAQVAGPGYRRGLCPGRHRGPGHPDIHRPAEHWQDHLVQPACAFSVGRDPHRAHLGRAVQGLAVDRTSVLDRGVGRGGRDVPEVGRVCAEVVCHAGSRFDPATLRDDRVHIRAAHGFWRVGERLAVPVRPDRQQAVLDDPGCWVCGGRGAGHATALGRGAGAVLGR